MRVIFFSVLAAFVLFSCSPSVNKSVLSTSLSYRNDNSNYGVYQGEDINTVDQIWNFKTGSAIRSTPLFYKSSIYFGSGDSIFYSLDANSGKERWQFKAEAAIHSSAALTGGKLFFNDRANNLYALNISNGKLYWKTKLGESLIYDWGFDYYLSSPFFQHNTIYTGSGDGHLYAVNAADGKVKWTFNAAAMVRTAPVISDDVVYFGDCNGKLYALDAATGKQKWMFNTIGDTLRNEEFGFDRKAIIASPVVKDNKVIIGSRDGYLYSVDALTGKEVWKFNYDISWVISTVAIKDSLVISGTSDGKIVNCINITTGKEIWRSNTSLVWSSPIIINNTVLTAQNDGFIYLHDVHTGKEKDRQFVGDRFFSSPVYDNGRIYVGNDNGKMYAFRTNNIAAKENKEVKRAVFWMKDPVYSARKYGIDVYVKDFFVSEGYQLLNEEQLSAFLAERIKDTISSVVIFATNLLPEKIIAGPAKTNLFYQYLKKGGKTVVTTTNPAIFSIDYKTKEFKGFDYSLAEGIMGLAYPYKDLRSHRGFYSTGLTEEGKKWGLTSAPISHSNINPKEVEALTIDETGNAGCWVKNYGHKKGTGFVQLWFGPENLNYNMMKQVKDVAEYGLR